MYGAPEYGGNRDRSAGRTSASPATCSPGATATRRSASRDARRTSTPSSSARARAGPPRPTSSPPPGWSVRHLREGPQPPARPRRPRPPRRGLLQRRDQVHVPPLPRPRPAPRAADLPSHDGGGRAHPRRARSTPSRPPSAAAGPTPTARCRASARRTSACSPSWGPVDGAARRRLAARLRRARAVLRRGRAADRRGRATPAPTRSPPGGPGPTRCRRARRCTARCSRRPRPSSSGCTPTRRRRRPTRCPTTAGRPATTAGSARSSAAPSTPRATRWPCCGGPC